MLKKLVLAVICLTGGAFLALIVWLLPSMLELNTVYIDNRSPIPVIVEIYDYSWRVEADAREIRRFRSNRGEASYRIIDAVTNTQMKQVGYVAGLLSECQLIRINPDYSIEAPAKRGWLCHLTGPGNINF